MTSILVACFIGFISPRYFIDCSGQYLCFLSQNITIKAVGSIHKIADLGRKVLLNDTNVNLTQMEAHGVTLLLSKVNTSLVGNHLLRLKDNEIQLPVGVFTRELKQALQGGSTQVIISSR